MTICSPFTEKDKESAQWLVEIIRLLSRRLRKSQVMWFSLVFFQMLSCALSQS